MAIFSEEEQQKIIQTITLAENQTSGEIRIAVERRCQTNAYERAAFFFDKLKMHETSLRNGVLIYVAVDDHTFAIIGDQGIHTLVPSNFWEETKNQMLVHFKENDLPGGVITGIEHVGKQLETFFPVSDQDINELPNEVYFGDDITRKN